MWIAVVGVDHTTAPIDLRERLACEDEQAAQVMSAARQVAQECVLLSTCNRVELYASGSGRFGEELKQQLLHAMSAHGGYGRVPFDDIQAHSYCASGKTAASHLFEVACGLRSHILGEPQIQGQVVEAFEQARVAGYCGPVMSSLFRAAIVAGKRARSETGISRSAVSVSHVAVQMARGLFPRLKDATVLLIGSGQMSELAARNLRDNGAGRLIIINRTPERAIELAQRNDASYRLIEELPDALVEADVVISSTFAPHALITLDMMREVLQRKQSLRGYEVLRRDQGDREGAPLPYTNGANDEAGRVGAHPRGRPVEVPLLLIDIALPRDIEPAVGKLPGVHLYNLDDLQSGVSQGIEQRTGEVERVRAIIATELGAFEGWLRARSVTGAIAELRQRADDLRQQELERTLRQLSTTLSNREIEAVQELSRSLVNKLLHTPTLRLKEAALNDPGRVYAKAFDYFFDLEVPYEEEYYDWDPGEQASDDSDSLSRRAPSAVMAGSSDND